MTAKTDTTSVTFRIPNHLLGKVDEHQRDTGLSRTAVILLALRQGLQHLDAPDPEEMRALRAYQDWLTGASRDAITTRHEYADSRAAMQAVSAARRMVAEGSEK